MLYSLSICVECCDMVELYVGLGWSCHGIQRWVDQSLEYQWYDGHNFLWCIYMCIAIGLMLPDWSNLFNFSLLSSLFAVRYHLDEDPKCLKVLSIPLHDSNGAVLHLDRIAVSPDNKLLAVTHGSTLQWLTLNSGETLETVEHAHDGKSQYIWLNDSNVYLIGVDSKAVACILFSE